MDATNHNNPAATDHARAAAFEQATRIARQEMMRDSLDEARNGTDFFETNVLSVRALVERVFETAYAAGLAAAQTPTPTPHR